MAWFGLVRLKINIYMRCSHQFHTLLHTLEHLCKPVSIELNAELLLLLAADLLLANVWASSVSRLALLQPVLSHTSLSQLPSLINPYGAVDDTYQ